MAFRLALHEHIDIDVVKDDYSSPPEAIRLEHALLANRSRHTPDDIGGEGERFATRARVGGEKSARPCDIDLDESMDHMAPLDNGQILCDLARSGVGQRFGVGTMGDHNSATFENEWLTHATASTPPTGHTLQRPTSR
jgi:hypothetical protein